MALPFNYSEKLVAHIKAKVTKPCDACGTNDWGIVDKPLSLPVFDASGNVIIPTPSVPCGAAICKNCGNLRLIALGGTGILS